MLLTRELVVEHTHTHTDTHNTMWVSEHPLAELKLLSWGRSRHPASQKVVSGSVASLQYRSWQVDKTVTSFSQDFFFFSHSVFFSFFFFCYPTTVTANSAQVHGNWPAPRAGGVGEFGVLKGLRMRTFAVGVKPLFLATLSLLAAELYQWDLFYCSVHFLSSSRSETSSFFFIVIWQKISPRHMPPLVSAPSLLTPLPRFFFLISFVWPFIISPLPAFLLSNPLFLSLHLPFILCSPSYPPSVSPSFSPCLPTSGISAAFVHPSRSPTKRAGCLRESKSLFTTVTHYEELHSGKTKVSFQ